MVAKNTRLALLVINGDIYSRGARKLAGYVENQGFDVKLLFFPIKRQTSGIKPGRIRSMDNQLLEEVTRFVADSQVIGFSCMTDFMPVARQIGNLLRSRYPDKLFLLGGVHAIQNREDAVTETFADGICFQEGEKPLVELLNSIEDKRSFRSVAGFYFKSDDAISKNQPSEVVSLDKLPLIDPGRGFIALDKSIRPITENDLKKFFGTTYWTDFSRGCPYHCSYCIHSRLVKEHGVRVKRVSPDYFIAETKMILDKYPFFNCLCFCDETVTAHPGPYLEELFGKYNQSINLPFTTYIDPFSSTERKIDLLIESGLSKLKIGVQSCSENVCENVFDRRTDLAKLASIMRQVSKLNQNRSYPVLDFITSVPWAKADDKIENYRKAATLEPPFHTEVFTLSYYPGSMIYERALNEKYITKIASQQNHVRPQPTVENLLLKTLGIVKLPQSLIDVFCARGWPASNKKIPIIFWLVYYFLVFRKLTRQVVSADPTLLPYGIVRFFQGLGFFSVRKTTRGVINNYGDQKYR